MTNTFDHLQSLIADLGFKEDPGFSGHPTLYSESGDAAMVLAMEAQTLFVQLYWCASPGDDFEMLRHEEFSLNPGWGRYGPVTAERRIRELVHVLPRLRMVV
jgi:hypothetical protein